MTEERVNGLLARKEELIARIEELRAFIKEEDNSELNRLDVEELKLTESLLKIVKRQIKITKPYMEDAVFKDMSMVGFLEDTEGNGFYFEDKDGNKVSLRSFQDPFREGLSYLNLKGIKESDFDGLLFDFDGNDLSKSVEVVEDQGIRIKPNNGHPIFIPWYVHDKEWSDDDMSLVLARITDETDGSFDYKEWDISGNIGSMDLIKYYGKSNE